MTLAIIGALGLLAFIAVAYFQGRKAGSDSTAKKTAEASLEKAVEATRPATPDERTAVVLKYQRR